MHATRIVCIAALGLAACHKVDESTHPEPPPPLTTKNLRAVWGTGPADVWAVGDNGTILHFNGKAWTPSPSGTEENLTSVIGTGPASVWVSGEKGAILHWDGAVWRQVSAEADTTLVNLWASGPDDVWGVGVNNGDEGGYMRHWNGTKWEAQGVPGSSSLWGVGGTGPHDVWMVGNSPKGDGYVIHGDGKHFDANGYKGPPARAVWCAKPDDVWVAPYQGMIQHWNGTTWAESQSPVGTWFRLGGSGPDDFWAVGLNGASVRYHAGAWATLPTGTNQIVWSVWSPSATAAWAVGNNGTLLRWDGAAWAH
jgi:hypothetical protein